MENLTFQEMADLILWKRPYRVEVTDMIITNSHTWTETALKIVQTVISLGDDPRNNYDCIKLKKQLMELFTAVRYLE